MLQYSLAIFCWQLLDHCNKTREQIKKSINLYRICFIKLPNYLLLRSSNVTQLITKNCHSGDKHCCRPKQISG